MLGVVGQGCVELIGEFGAEGGAVGGVLGDFAEGFDQGFAPGIGAEGGGAQAAAGGGGRAVGEAGFQGDDPADRLSEADEALDRVGCFAWVVPPRRGVAAWAASGWGSAAWVWREASGCSSGASGAARSARALAAVARANCMPSSASSASMRR